MDPIVVQKQIRDSHEDLRSFLTDLNSWEKDMKRKDKELLTNTSESESLPPVRSKVKRSKCSSSQKTTDPQNSKRISSYDYSSWDKFDVEKACAEIDETEKEHLDSEPELSEQDVARQKEQAMYEKELGNQHVKEQKWKDAIVCYSNAIEYNPYDAIFYANRALCYLKTKKPKLAETDCTTALQLDKTYVKAYQRRALARIELGLQKDAREDFEKVLELEPSNSAAKNELAKLEKAQQPKTRSKEQKVAAKFLREKAPNACSTKQTTVNPVMQETKDWKADTVRTLCKESLSGEAAVLHAEARGAGGDAGHQGKVRRAQQEESEEVILPIEKPPHRRSKKPLRMVPIQEVETFDDLLCTAVRKPHKNNKVEEIVSTDNIPDVKSEEEKCEKSDSREVQTSAAEPENTKTASVKTSKPPPAVQQVQLDNSRNARVPAVPKTSVQFFVSWKLVKNQPEMRYQFLKQIPGLELACIFQDSLESREFSEITSTLAADFIERNEAVYTYLLGLSQVKRFSALVMFLSKAEKTVVKKLLDYSFERGECSKEELSDLFKRYELK